MQLEGINAQGLLDMPTLLCQQCGHRASSHQFTYCYGSVECACRWNPDAEPYRIPAPEPVNSKFSFGGKEYNCTWKDRSWVGKCVESPQRYICVGLYEDGKKWGSRCEFCHDVKLLPPETTPESVKSQMYICNQKASGKCNRKNHICCTPHKECTGACYGRICNSFTDCACIPVEAKAEAEPNNTLFNLDLADIKGCNNRLKQFGYHIQRTGKKMVQYDKQT